MHSQSPAEAQGAAPRCCDGMAHGRSQSGRLPPGAGELPSLLSVCFGVPCDVVRLQPFSRTACCPFSKTPSLDSPRTPPCSGCPSIPSRVVELGIFRSSSTPRFCTSRRPRSSLRSFFPSFPPHHCPRFFSQFKPSPAH